MPLKIVRLCIFCALLFSCAAIKAQQKDIDSASTNNLAMADYYHQAIGYSSGLYSGVEYKPHSPLINGIPFYLSNDWRKGTVTYNNVIYTNVLIKYDLVDDQLLALLYNQAIPYILNRTKVASFEIDNHHFIYEQKDSLQRQSFTNGFYEQLYDGKAEVLARYEKGLVTSGGSVSVESKYNDRVRYYIKNKGLYYNVGSNGSAADALRDKKKLIQQFLKANQIKINKNLPAALVQVAAYYNTLSN